MRLFKLFVLSLFILPVQLFAASPDANTLFLQMREKLGYVKDYVADVKMKVDVTFMKVPPLHGKLYFKAPDKMKLDRSGGISIMPRRSISMTLNNLIPSGDATVIDAGYEQVGTVKTKVIKVVPGVDQTDIVLTKIWIDETRMLALRTETTTRDNGTINMDLVYGKYADIGLPDKITFLVDVKEFKLPKGVTMDYDQGNKPPATTPETGKQKRRKGKIEITYLSYMVNKGISDDVFRDDKK
jgi:outer membrane lipoprotein-sorting protein